MAEHTDRKFPEIRFKGFEGEWVEKDFREVTTKIGSGKTPRGGDSSYVANGVPLLRSQNITNNSVNLHKVAFITEETDTEMANSRVKENDVLLNITGASIGRSAVYRSSNFANVNQHVCIIRPTENYCSSFFQLHLASTKGQKKIDNNQAGGAREGLNFQQISGMSFDYPSFEEQTQIGEYFKELDGMIGLHQRKHGKLVTLKQAMLQKMFPQNGATTPEIRFKGFSEDWVEKAFSDIATLINGRAYSQNELLRKGRYRVLRVGNFYTNSSWYFSDMELDEKYYAEKGDLLYTWSASFGPHIWAGEKVIYHYHIWKVELSKNLRVQFALQILENDRKRILSGSSGSTMVHITKEGMEKKMFLIPDPAEQKKIGTYFRQLDTLISQHATQLEKLKQLKSACLEKMFV